MKARSAFGRGSQSVWLESTPGGLGWAKVWLVIVKNTVDFQRLVNDFVGQKPKSKVRELESVLEEVKCRAMY